jgi:NADH-quinone oxidoreductase subunit H
MRSAAQIVGYEIPIGIIILTITLWTGTLQLNTLAELQGIGQGTTLFSIPAINTSVIGGILTWNLFQNPVMPFLFIIFFIASLAECNRAPFDLPEGESELVSGFHTEYSGFRFAMFFLAEYAMMFLMSVVMVFLFLGAWHSPLPNIGSFKLFDFTTGHANTLQGQLLGTFWIFVKAVLLCIIMVIARWTYPRLRIDQLMNLCWKYLTPISLIALVITAWLKL